MPSKRKIFYWGMPATVIAIGALSWAVAKSVSPEKIVSHKLAGTYEPSAVQQLPDGRLLVAEDEAVRALSLLTVNADGTLQENQAADSELMNSLKVKLDDLEALAADDKGYIYAATSFSSTKKNSREPDRERFVRFKIQGNRIQDLKEAVNLKEALLKASEVQKTIQSKTGKPVDFHDLNLEGLAYDTKNNRLMLGIREPMAGKLAMVIPINNPNELFENKAAPRFGEVLLLDLEGGGIRSLEYMAETDSYLIANELANEQGKFRSYLWRWAGKPQSQLQKLVLNTDEKWKNAEAVNVIKADDKQYLLVMSDDGKAKKNKPSSYILINYKNIN
ncbi:MULTISPECIES: DUF3616 domain-containing protein [Neisseria]|nr:MULTISPECIES: DUF3616 domain-containing protein [Neisseria]QMT36270.1 DUF3616 domain-containing protein [Neisseria wadsworthii]